LDFILYLPVTARRNRDRRNCDICVMCATYTTHATYRHTQYMQHISYLGNECGEGKPSPRAFRTKSGRQTVRKYRQPILYSIKALEMGPSYLQKLIFYTVYRFFCDRFSDERLLDTLHGPAYNRVRKIK
jgi:hypothetical protein